MEKSELLNYRALVLEVRHIRSYLARLEDLRDTVAGTQLSFTPKGPPVARSPVAAQAGRFVDAEALFRERVAGLEAHISHVEQAIGSLADPVERLILRLRYMDGKGWSSICSQLQNLGYCERQVYYIHGAALKKLKEV